MCNNGHNIENNMRSCNEEHNHNSACHGCNHESVNLKSKIISILTSLIIFIIAVIIPYLKKDILNLKLIDINVEIIQIILYLISYLIIGFEIIKEAIKNILKGKIFDENFLMTLATVAAFITNEYPEGVMVMWLYQVGELFQHYAVGKSRKSISELMDIRPDYANVEKNGALAELNPEEVKIDDIIVVKPGEKIALDGIIIDGESLLDTVALTGEAAPRKVESGSEVFAGCINKTGVIRIKVTKLFTESTVSKILELVEKASDRKAKAENFISKFARYYTPIVVVVAVLLAFLPPLLIKDANVYDYIHRACAFLVISCPCALVISIPLGFFAGIGGASKHGILIKGSNYLEALSKTKKVIMDKTGTLTKGNFSVTKINPINISQEELLEITALAEIYSEHPIANSIKNEYSQITNSDLNLNRVENIKEISGHGIFAKIDGKEVYVGNEKLMKEYQIEYIKAEKEIGTIVYVAVEKMYVGYIVIADEIKEEAKETISKLKQINKVNNIEMLTGDNEKIANEVANELNIDEVYAELLPQDKVDKLEKILENKKESESLIFIGDGINDAPVLMRADVGIAMGGLGSDAAIEAADVVIMDDNISKISTAISLSKRTLKIVKQNIVFAITIKVIVLVLGAFGITNMWQAVFADVGVSFIAILNSMRALNCKK